MLALLACLSAGIMFIATHIVNYRRYYAGGSGKHTMILTIASWVPTSTGVMAYTFSNFLAMLLLKSQAKPFRPWVSRIWVTVYNFVLVIGLVGYTVPCLVSLWLSCHRID